MLSLVHLSTTEVSPYLGPGAPPLTDAEQTYLAHRAEWDRTERGYSSVLSTRPPSLGYGLNDSPAGLAAPPPHNLTVLPPTSPHSSTRCERRCVEYTLDIAHRPHGPTTRVTGEVVRPDGPASHTEHAAQNDGSSERRRALRSAHRRYP
jgi:hypothetical protein